jgi:hypothetical protein
MRLLDLTRLLAALAIAVLMVFAASCGGGGGSDETGGGGIIGGGDNNIPGNDDSDDPTGYDGKDDKPGEPDVDTDIPQQDDDGPFNFGPNIFALPMNSTGTGKVVANSFSPGQKVAFVVVNLNPAYLDSHFVGGSILLPDSAYSISADLVMKGSNSVKASSLGDLQASTESEIGSLADYKGLPFNKSQANPAVLYKREAVAEGKVPYAAEPPKAASASVVQKGEIRTFVNVQPVTPPPPIVLSGDAPAGGSEPEWPYIYKYSQDARLVAIGAHCLVWLSREINNGTPDTIRFTEARLHQLATEFDSNIYPTLTTALGPVKSFEDGNILKGLDRTRELKAEDFDEKGNLLTELPGTVDTQIGLEQKINILLYNTNESGGGFYTWMLSGAARELLQKEGRSDADIERLEKVGSTVYIQATNFPVNDDGWTAAYSVISHEFQHKLWSDNGLPTRLTDPRGNFQWLNEGMSQLAIHLCGYTVNSGKIIDWAIDGQLTDYLEACNEIPLAMDGSPQWNYIAQYGNSFLFMLYVNEHYPAGFGKRIYQAAKSGQSNFSKLVEAGTGEPFKQTFTKFCIANYIDGIYDGVYNDPANDLFDPRFHYNTIDLRGTVNLSSGTIVLPGVRQGQFPTNGTYPIQQVHRTVRPWCADYLVFGNGNGTDLEVTIYADPNTKVFMLPVNWNDSLNAVTVNSQVHIP